MGEAYDQAIWRNVNTNEPVVGGTPKAPIVAVVFATVLGAGFSPLAPGTLGSLAGVGLSVITAGWPLLMKAAVFLLVSVVGVWSAQQVGKSWGHDHRRIVIDEVAGQYLALMFHPQAFIAGFLAFRLFDVLKPEPARIFDRRKGGIYTMADDWVAGAYALATVTLWVKWTT